MEIIDELLLIANNSKNVKLQVKNNKGLNKINSLNDGEEESKIINENSIYLEIDNFTQDESEFSNFYDNKEFLQNMQIKILHSIIFCDQKLYLFNDILCYCDKILEIDGKDWVARLKRGLYYSLFQQPVKADIDFKLALEMCPHKEMLKKELAKIQF